MPRNTGRGGRGDGERECYHSFKLHCLEYGANKWIEFSLPPDSAQAPSALSTFICFGEVAELVNK